jgi:hypothetical protein
MTNDPQTPSAKAGPSHATVFIWLFAIASIWHYTSSSSDINRYWFHFDPLVTPLIFLSITTAFIAACFPARTIALLVFSVGQLVAICLRFPFVADHLVMELILHIGIVMSFVYLAVKRRSLQVTTTEMFNLFGPVGRWLLIIMYLYGTFHKFNPGFMSLESSCAIPFIQGFPLVGGLATYDWVQYAAIYSTLILESVAMILLLSARTKYVGMLLGMTFHFMIGISNFGTLAHFSAFALALHTLFVPSEFGQRLYQERFLPAFAKTRTNFQAFTIGLVMLQVLLAIHLATTREAWLVNTLFAVFAVTLIALVFKCGSIRQGDAPYRLKSDFLPLNVLPVWFFLHCLSPYIGLGTGGVLAMFSGLRTEGGISNHYIIQKPVQLFHYQDDIVYVEDATNGSLRAAAREKQGVVAFDFDRHFSVRQKLEYPLRLRIGDTIYPINNPDDYAAFGAKHFKTPSWLERKYMSFRLVDEPQPNKCRH